MTSTEQLILVDEQDNPIGACDKMAAHEQALCHRAFSVFIIRPIESDIEILLQQRNPNKYHCGGLWTNTCCGHPRPEEPTQAAATRRLTEEMGIQTDLTYLDKFHYIAPFDNGLTENEIDHVFYATLAAPKLAINPAEVSDYKWMPAKALQQALAKTPDDHTPWLKPALDILLSKIR